MRAITIDEPGGPEVLRLTETDPPEPGPGQVAVDVAAAGVNFIDIYQRSGLYPMPMPLTPGVEAAGTVAAVGAGVTGLDVGQPVGWTGEPGGYAERAVVRADRVVPVPEGVGAEQAAAVLLQGMTAHYLTHSTYPVRAGDTVLVHAAAGGTGLLLVQMAKLRGARVIGTVSTAAKEELARAAGADEVIRYDEPDADVAAAVRGLTGGEGVPVVYDGVGASTFEASLGALRRRGMLVLFGQSSGPVPPFDPQRLNGAGALFLTRPSLAHYTADRAELLDRAAAVFGMIGAGDLEVRIGGRYPLAEAARAQQDLASRSTTGKLVLRTRD
ncbi:quinone oxidoreductase family protein [Nocardiopsis composta]|uniref:NADPH2:quinone reductase n=1 Tax=Nocardiopsis composta TaxID=157465 RepID=A0A7W8VGJ3_9ACTN|nr:quinone oxidoreductase [Nocardiopsis composta]MBB5435235.1 NADPH2:quinone reductase [Nocardiopsis composta]